MALAAALAVVLPHAFADTETDAQPVALALEESGPDAVHLPEREAHAHAHA
ncbi:hypothetical protein ACIA8O_18955 [Kitasatospora sp. NPDC051853]|uniref:hypothetical protein n=1 Tax=Kitasatospora sp. NPDC051853 TaxID=3364058 RepID=UPI0037968A83